MLTNLETGREGQFPTAKLPPRRNESLLIVIDGPGGVGKTSIGLALADRYGVPFISSGSLYRSVALAALQNEISNTDVDKLTALVSSLPISFDNVQTSEGGGAQKVLLDGKDVSTDLRSDAVSEASAVIAAIPAVRAEVQKLQRTLTKDGGVIEGRDLGTVVFPETKFKFFLTADEKERMARRERQAAIEGIASESSDTLKNRDRADKSRKTSPLKAAPDAIVIDSTEFEMEETLGVFIKKIDEIRAELASESTDKDVP